MHGCSLACWLAFAGLAFFTGLSEENDAEIKEYTGHHVIRVTPQHGGHLELLRHLAKRSTDHLDFWTSPSEVGRYADIRVSPQVREDIEGVIDRAGMPRSAVTEDLGSAIDNERMDRVMSGEGDLMDGQQFNLSIYHTYEEIMEWLDYIVNQCGEECEIINIGNSYENRNMKVVRIGRPGPGKPVVWIDAGIHAREWIAPAATLHVIATMVGNLQSGDPEARKMVSSYTWYFLPLANPDGYAFTWTNDRLWRKTRSRHPRSSCRGADPNRNWDFHWGGAGTSANPCQENFRGVAAFSEVETRAIRDFLRSLRPRVSVYLSLHSYGQYWLTPWGFTNQLPTDYSDMTRMGNEAARAIRNVNGTRYQVGSSSNMLYLAAGGSDDWAKGVLRVKYSYTVELGDTGRHGFVLPADYIRPTGEEMYSGLQALGEGVLREKRAAAARRRRRMRIRMRQYRRRQMRRRS